MEKHSIDEIVKNHLIDRSIEPTASAWDRLDAMLTTAEEKPKNKRNIFWISILAAASCVSIIMTMVHIVYNDHQSVTDRNNGLIMVESNLPSNAQESEILKPIEILEDSEPEYVTVEKSNNKPNNSKKSFISQVVPKVIEEYKLNSSLESENNNLGIVTNLGKEENVINSGFVTEKVNKTYTLRINADKLLANIESQNTIQIQTSLSQVQTATTSKIDPNKLLREAENEVNEKFMHKIFKNLQETTVQVLTSVSQRNEEK